MNNKRKIKKLRAKIKSLKWEITNGIAFVFNITPNNHNVKIYKSLDKQLLLLSEALWDVEEANFKD